MGQKRYIMKHIVRNAIKCLECGDVIESLHRHDWAKCSCGACFVDGGREYLRSGGSINKMRVMFVYSTDPHSEVRKAFKWGSYSGDKQYITLEDMTTTHIQGVLDTQSHIADWVRKMFEDELAYRSDVHE